MEYQARQKKNAFSNASMLLGIFALLSLTTIILPLPLAALGILFASLAHKKGQKREMPCLIGLITSIVALVISIFTIIGSLVMLPTMLKNPEYRKQLDVISEQIYGEDFDDMIETLYRIDIDDLFQD